MKEIKDKELEKVAGGTNNTSDNPKGFVAGDRVYFYYDIIDHWMWGTFLFYDGQYRVRWDDTKIVYASGVYMPVPADETSVPEEYIK